MNEEEYRDFVMSMASDETLEDPILAAALGLAGEAGEVADTVKKTRFHGHPVLAHEMLNELGDLYFYFTLELWAMGYSLQEVIDENVRKLNECYPEGFESERSINR